MINPDIQKLRTVLMVSKTLNFSEAAYELNFTPSAISKQVISVEKSLGVTLFDRHSRNGVTLTPEMQKLLPTLQQVVSSFDAFEGVLRTISLEPTFYIGTPPLFPSQVTSQVIAEMVQKIPSLEIEVMHHDSRTLLKLLQLGKIDAVLSVILGQPEDNPEFYESMCSDLAICPLRKTQDVVFLNEKHPLAKKQTIYTKDLMECAEARFLFINTRPHTMSRRERIFQRTCENYGVKREIREVNLEAGIAINTILRRIATSPGYIAFGPEGLSRSMSGVVERTCEDTIYPIKEVICYRKNNKSRVMKVFLEAAKKMAGNLAKDPEEFNEK